MLWMLTVGVAADNMHWKDPKSGAVFDWSALKHK